MRSFVLLILMLTVIGCSGCSSPVEDYYLTSIKLPDGSVIMAEQMRTQEQMMRGMMFRDELKPDRGMLFSHGGPGKYPYWMYQVKVPLDILWLDARRQIVEISAQTPPCEKGPASKCPHYGGSVEALFVVELASGAAAKHRLKLGDPLIF